MKVKIIHVRRGIIFEGESEEILLPMADGEIGVLEGHSEYFALLKAGKVSVRGKTPFDVDIDEGWVRVKDDGSSLVLVR